MTVLQPNQPTSVFYERGSIPTFASQVDPRLHYCMYVPQQHQGR